MIAEQLLDAEKNDMGEPEGLKFQMKTKESLRILLQSPESCLEIEDILPLLHPKTKMKDIKHFLA